MEAESCLVIYDGQCDFCIAWLRWLRWRLDVNALSYHEADLAKYGLTSEECSRSVFVITEAGKYPGAAAIAYLLNARGDRLVALILRSLGPLGRLGYRWVAGHRNSLLIRSWTKYLERRLTDES